MNKEKALKNQGLEFREDMVQEGGGAINGYNFIIYAFYSGRCNHLLHLQMAG